ncbi:MAG: ABC transporter ATP-binding protein [Cocleimonas sp.]
MTELLSIENLEVEFEIESSRKNQQILKAVKGVSLAIAQGETVAIVGESGAGKSQLFHALMGLLPDNGTAKGEVHFLGQSILNQSTKALNKIRGKEIGMIFQDPMTSLNPYLRIGKQLTEVIHVHLNIKGGAAKNAAIKMLDKVQIKNAEQLFNAYPHELSGGMRQRVAIAMALLCKPKLLIADEPTTALDVTVQTEIIRLLRKIHKTDKTSIVLITHDLPLVAGLCDRILVMYAGEIVESGTVEDIFYRAKHPYTQSLLSAAPQHANKTDKEQLETSSNKDNKKILTVDNVGVTFNKGKKTELRALKDISFSLNSNEILGIVGESGCGKSTLARAILKLQPIISGSINWHEKKITSFNKAQQKEYRRNAQLIFQDPLDALNPRKTVIQIIAEPLQNLMPDLSTTKIQQKSRDILISMGLQEEQKNRYPHEFSGGQCQRIGIARAMVLEPELLVCDEPVSALDVSTQAQIIKLLLKLKEQTGMSMIFISHDLSVVRQLCDRVLVLYKGEIVEIGDVEQIYSNPQHDYTKTLLNAVPLTDPIEERKRIDSLSKKSRA